MHGEAIRSPSTPALRAENFAPPGDLDRLRGRALAVGLAGAAALGVGAFLDAQQFFRSYLIGWLLWTGVAAGSLGLLMLHHLSRGSWGLIIRRVLEASARTLPVMLALFVPVLLFGMQALFPWARPEAAADELIQHKAAYLNLPFFVGRLLGYFAIATAFAYALSALSRRQDETSDPQLFHRMQRWAAPGIVIFVLLATVGSTDWLMSLDPHWFSSLFGLHFLISQALAGLAFTILITTWLAARPPMSHVVQARHLHDYGKLLFAFTMVWAYFSFSQFLIIWSGNLPEEITFYINRTHGGWKVISLLVIVLHFFLPFSLLLSRDLKRSAKTLAPIAALLFVARWLDIYWQAAPSYFAFGSHGGHGGAFHLSWMDPLAPIALGGIWMWFFLGQLRRRSLLPVHDPYLSEALEHD